MSREPLQLQKTLMCCGSGIAAYDSGTATPCRGSWLTTIERRQTESANRGKIPAVCLRKRGRQIGAPIQRETEPRHRSTTGGRKWPPEKARPKQEWWEYPVCGKPDLRDDGDWSRIA